MTDVALIWDNQAMSAGIAIEHGDLVGGDDFAAAVVISLFTDRRASKDDIARLALSDRRGFWGDAFATVEGDLTGSYLWLLKREKLTAETMRRAKDYAAESLAWMIEDGAAKSIDVVVERHSVNAIALHITIRKPSGELGTYSHIWDKFS